MTERPTDSQVLERIRHALDDASFPALDPVPAMRAGRLLRRRRAVTRTLSGVATLAVVVVTTLAVLSRGAGAPSPAFGDPGSRSSLAGAGGPADGYPDLVVSRDVDTDGSTTITGFGWPIAGMRPVSDARGHVDLPPLSKADAESICLPMLHQGAPGVPDAAWRHSGAWIDGFPTRAGLTTNYEASFEGRHYDAACTMPGDYTPRTRPDLARVPGPDPAVLAQCSYLGHVDFRAWRVAARDRAAQTLAAVLVSPDGHVARCVLSRDPEQRVVQVSSTTLARTTGGGVPLYGGDGTSTLTLAGAVGPDVATIEVRTAGETHTYAVHDQAYAVALDVGRAVPADDTRVRALGADGSVLAQAGLDARAHGTFLQPTICFTTVETGQDGC